MTIATIHETAIVHPGAKLGKGVKVGPYCIVGEHVVLGPGTELQSNVVVTGWTTLGENNRIFHGAVIGTEPQDVRYAGEETYVKIGDNNFIREYATIHRATGKGNSTLIGNNNMIMAYVHIAHNCIIGNEVTIANSVGLSGHVEVEDQVTIGGYAGSHQFVRIGRLAMVGGYSRIVKDIPPFAMAVGQPTRLYGINFRGMRRRNISAETRADIKIAFKMMAGLGLPLPEVVQRIRDKVPCSPELKHLLDFLEKHSKMGVLFRNLPARPAVEMEGEL